MGAVVSISGERPVLVGLAAPRAAGPAWNWGQAKVSRQQAKGTPHERTLAVPDFDREFAAVPVWKLVASDLA